MRLAALLVLMSLVSILYAKPQEKGKTDPCASAQTQAEMNQCAGREYKTADAELNQVYRQLITKLDEQEKAQLKEAQTAWLKYRDANCEFVADQYRGGTIRPMIHGLCLAEMTRNRTSEIRSQIKDRNN